MPTKKTTTSKKIAKKQFCTYCGEELKAGANFCTNCGVKLHETDQELMDNFDELDDDEKEFYEDEIKDFEKLVTLQEESCERCERSLSRMGSIIVFCGWFIPVLIMLGGIWMLWTSVWTSQQTALNILVSWALGIVTVIVGNRVQITDDRKNGRNLLCIIITTLAISLLAGIFLSSINFIWLVVVIFAARGFYQFDRLKEDIDFVMDLQNIVYNFKGISWFLYVLIVSLLWIIICMVFPNYPLVQTPERLPNNTEDRYFEIYYQDEQIITPDSRSPRQKIHQTIP